MLIGSQLIVRRQPFQGISLQAALVVVEVVKHPGFEDEEAPVDPAFADLRLFCKGCDHSAIVEDESTEARRRAHRRDGRNAAM